MDTVAPSEFVHTVYSLSTLCFHVCACVMLLPLYVHVYAAFKQLSTACVYVRVCVNPCVWFLDQESEWFLFPPSSSILSGCCLISVKQSLLSVRALSSGQCIQVRGHMQVSCKLSEEDPLHSCTAAVHICS